ncbi:hypothetical protein JGV33_004669 [Salmonella enterica subsp. enterica serovar Kentucky]|nr:hypothetical protein [Salmonella enterica subsp. enterica serovar Kentucky]EBL4393997.1 hypothetical protein [Salmonella enterica subsp. enterica serovar Kentucky]EBM8796817.1 hypothetical protein [Salmonella enterica subsp. enterica serovar Kentucky]EBO2305834.1 hypothetical protein [Salmonella enterica subsp. enterica serovar Kentucky]ECH7496008.1 hypothetical protein [Salmonella enterica subsp. enterica serovar Kentucky]
MENGFPHVKRIDLNEWLRYKQLPFVCEKPLSTDLNSARYLQEIAPKGSIVSFNYRYNPVIDMIMRLRNEKKLGELHFFCKRAARTVLTGMCYSVGSATRQGSSSPTRFIGQSAMTSRT